MNWISKAVGKGKGNLHRNLGIPQGKKISAKQLARGAKMGGKVAKEVSLARTLKGFHK